MEMADKIQDYAMASDEEEMAMAMVLAVEEEAALSSAMATQANLLHRLRDLAEGSKLTLEREK